MEIKDMTMEEVQKRTSEINELLTGDAECDIQALTEEFNQLEARSNEIKKNVEMRKELVAKVATGAIGEVKEVQEERKTMNEIETRAEQLVNNGRIETRAILSTGTIAKPSNVGGINDLASAAASIVDDVHAIALSGAGSWVSAYKATATTADDVTDGSAVASASNATYNYVTINPAEVGTFEEVSAQVKKMTPINYLAEVEKSALAALRAKMAAKIVAAVQASTLKQTMVSTALDADYLKKVVLGYNAIDGKGECVLYMPLADLRTLSTARGTNEKKAIYTITFDQGTTKSGTIAEGGMAVKFRVLDALTTGVQMFGQPQNIDMPMWDNYNISTDEGGKFFEKNTIGVRGLQTANADLCAKNGMIVIKQAAS